jgi:pimeloyl-ACP methyl ester carboxylesterase
VRHPDLWGRATLVGFHPGLTSDRQRVQRRAEDARWIDMLEHDGVERFAASWERQPIFEDQAALGGPDVVAQRAIRRSHRASGLAGAMRALGLAEMPSYWDSLEEISVEISMVVGERDTKFRGIADLVAPRMRRGGVRFAPGAGHNVVLERPEWMAAEIDRAAEGS